MVKANLLDRYIANDTHFGEQEYFSRDDVLVLLMLALDDEELTVDIWQKGYDQGYTDGEDAGSEGMYSIDEVEDAYSDGYNTGYHTGFEEAEEICKEGNND